MNLAYSDLIGLNIGAIAQSKKVGNVCDVIVDPVSGKAIALAIKKYLVSIRPNAISWLDIREIDKSAIVITDEDVILPMNELVMANELFRNGFNVVGLPVFSKQKKKLGNVSDYWLDCDTGSLMSILVKGPWGYKAIFNRVNILKIDMERVVVKSDTSSKRVVTSATPELAEL